MPPVQLVITMTPDGQVQVSGPLQNKVLCYGMLESARDAIRDFKPNVGVELANGDKAKALLRNVNGNGR